MSMRLRRVLAISTLAGFLAAPALATVWLAPQAQLTENEWLEYDISGADAIGVGILVAVHDTIVDVAPDGSGIPVQAVTLHIRRWLRGDPGTSDLRAGLSVLDEQPLRGEDLYKVAGTDREVVAMLRRLPDGWGLCDGPDPAGSGMRLLPRGDSAGFERHLRRLIARQEVDSLLTRADAVVLGRCEAFAPCGPGEERRCASISVEATLSGTVAPGNVSVLVPLPGDIPPESAVYLLRKAPGGYYETVGFQAGSQALNAGRVRRWNLSVPEIRARLRKLGSTGSVPRPNRD